MQPEYRELLSSSFEAYLDRLADGQMEPSERFLPFDFPFIEGRQWHLLAQEMIACDLRELTNLLNHWQSALHRWHAWNDVLSGLKDESAWDLRHEFLESLAHDCLLRPSSVRDALVAVATAALHQVRLSLPGQYRDYLEGDPVKPDDKPKHLSRRRKEEQLARLASVWPEASAFLAALAVLDSKAYRSATSDYRNLTSHAIGPRLGLGHTRTVTRTVGQATKTEEQGDGTVREVLIPGKMAVWYGYGGTPPLNLDEARLKNLEQFAAARASYGEYLRLLEAAVANILPTRPRTDA